MKRLGQHFLKNASAIRKVIDAMELKPGDTIIEIGPGHGELTEVLGFRLKVLDNVKIIAVEKDDALATNLESKMGSVGDGMKVIHGDALKVIPSLIYNLQPKTYKLVGNIPYYITGKLLRILSELPTKPELCVFTIQKEVAERICAAPPRMNRLAAIVQFWADPQLIGLIPREDFSPQPEVDSAIIKLVTSDKRRGTWKNYQRTVRVLFAQPRKTIVNNLSLKSVWGAEKSKESVAEALLKIGIGPKSRPQNLSVEDIVKIIRILTPGPRG